MSCLPLSSWGCDSDRCAGTSIPPFMVGQSTFRACWTEPLSAPCIFVRPTTSTELLATSLGRRRPQPAESLVAHLRRRPLRPQLRDGCPPRALIWAQTVETVVVEGMVAGCHRGKSGAPPSPPRTPLRTLDQLVGGCHRGKIGVLPWPPRTLLQNQSRAPPLWGRSISDPWQLPTSSCPPSTLFPSLGTMRVTRKSKNLVSNGPVLPPNENRAQRREIPNVGNSPVANFLRPTERFLKS